MKKRMYLFVFLAAIVLLTAAACKSKATGTKSIVLADCGWDSQLLHNALAKLVIEHAYDGYEVRSSTASTTMNWESIKNNDVDLQIETWPENLPFYPDDIKSGDIVEIGVLVEDSRQGLYVPRYVVQGDPARGIAASIPSLKKVEDLANYSHVFPDDENPSMGRIYGAIPGWVVDGILHKKYLYYGLDKNYNYMRMGSEAAIFASLMSAYNLGQPWVGYCYEPTWIAGKLDLLILEDAPYEPDAFAEGKTAFSTQKLTNVCSRQFPAKAPDLMEFLKNYKTGSALISDALAYLDETKATHDAAAIWFMKKNNALIDQWLPAGNAKKLREFLSQSS